MGVVGVSAILFGVVVVGVSAILLRVVCGGGGWCVRHHGVSPVPSDMCASRGQWVP